MPQNPPQIILDLIARFENNSESYRSAAYNETQLRREFIDPFFDALGWDVANKAGHAEAYKGVIHEDAIKVGVSTKAPDYCFRIGGARKFFLEAKKPAVNIKNDPEPAYQLRRYAWSAKLSLSILTDFEEFAVYDCRTRPQPNAKPATGRIHYWTYRDYAAQWDEIAGIFSKEAVLKGSFDKFAVSERRRGTATVDAAFLAEIEGWRDALARNLALRNPDLSVHDLNFAVQRTIDRIIFLRICEDRGVETYGELRALHNGENVYDRLRYLYKIADERYNSGLFHFQPEKGRAEAPDTLTPALRIDDKVLKDIIGSLYYPESPYEFSVFPIEILGQVYEQFLGKVIRLTPARHAKVEDKPEVKKAGGVYYTPAYIVDYIVKHTVGKLCEGKTPKQIAKLRILDPACGSGSFLIGAYTYLLDHHRDWYVKEGVAKHTKEFYQGAGGQWYLTTPEKKRILLSNIYGVDIDSQAVEVTKLSLLLKVLEGESQETIGRQLKMWRERALPDLGNNIKCGNSLIGHDYLADQLLPDEDAMRRISPFDWKVEFPEIMKVGGFDAVIGNPPWLMAGYYLTDTLDYLRREFKTAEGKFDLYYLFIEQGCRLVSSDGLFGMIVPNKFFHTKSASSLRVFLANAKLIDTIVDFGDDQLFSGATNYSSILFLRKRPVTSPRYLKAKVGLRIIKEVGIPWSVFSADTWHFEEQPIRNLFEKVERIGKPLEQMVARFGTGVQSGADSLLMVDSAVAKTQSLESALLHPVLRGRDIRRYSISGNPKLLIFPYKVEGDEFVVLPESELKAFKHIYVLLIDHREKLAQRVWFGRGAEELSGRWYGLMFLDSHKAFATPHILTPSLSNRSNFTMGTGDLFVTGTAGATSIISKREIGEDIRYILGVLNSRLISFYAISHSPVFAGGYFKFSSPYLKKLPIRRVNLDDRVDKAQHDKMVLLVERIMDLRRRLASAKIPDDQARLQRQITATDREIDILVYALYGLTEEDIAILEGAGVASDAEPKENTDDEDAEPSPHRPRQSQRQASGVAEAAQYAGESGDGPPENVAGAGHPVDGVRERSGEYGPSQDSPENQEERVGSTRLLETAEGPLPYRQVSERLAVALTGILEDIVHIPPDQIVVTPEWLCLRHQALAGVLFPAWAGRYRDGNVQVGAHTPPPFYEVLGLVRLFCDDLDERLRHVRPAESDVSRVAELLAWTDWRLQWIHPFKDFNGRIGRVLLATVLYKLTLPHVETAPLEHDARRRYLDALRAADGGDLGPLTDVWLHRLAASLS